MANSLLKKLKGYQKADRSRFKLLKDGILTIEELVLYELVIAITDWDPEHEHFGSFKVADEDIADTLGWKDRSSVCRYRNRLIKKGYITLLDNGYSQAQDFEKWELRKLGNKESAEEEVQKQKLREEIEQLELKRAELKHEMDVAKLQQEFSAEMQQSVENKQQDNAENQQNCASDTSYSLSSFKGEFNNENEEISIEEIHQISEAVDTELKIEEVKKKYDHLQENSQKVEPPKKYPPLDEKISSTDIDSIIEQIGLVKTEAGSTHEIIGLPEDFFDD